MFLRAGASDPFKENTGINISYQESLLMCLRLSILFLQSSHSLFFLQKKKNLSLCTAGKKKDVGLLSIKNYYFPILTVYSNIVTDSFVLGKYLTCEMSINSKDENFRIKSIYTYMHTCIRVCCVINGQLCVCTATTVSDPERSEYQQTLQASPKCLQWEIRGCSCSWQWTKSDRHIHTKSA